MAKWAGRGVAKIIPEKVKIGASYAGRGLRKAWGEVGKPIFKAGWEPFRKEIFGPRKGEEPEMPGRPEKAPGETDEEFASRLEDWEGEVREWTRRRRREGPPPATPPGVPPPKPTRPTPPPGVPSDWVPGPRGIWVPPPPGPKETGEERLRRRQEAVAVPTTKETPPRQTKGEASKRLKEIEKELKEIHKGTRPIKERPNLLRERRKLKQQKK